MFLGFNAGTSMDIGEDDFLKNNGFDVVGLYGGNVSFFELNFASTDMDSWEDSYFKTGGSTSLKYFYPIESGDSLGSRFSGYLFGFDLIGVNFFPTTSFLDFVISAGANTGSKKVSADNDVKYKNYVFAPKVSGELRLVFNDQFGLNVHVEQQIDITKARLANFSESFRNSYTLEIEDLYENNIPSGTRITLQIPTKKLKTKTTI